MTTREVKLDLPDGLVREAQAAGLLTPSALGDLLKNAIRQHAAQTLLAGAARASDAKSEPLSMQDIQAETKTVRRSKLVSMGRPDSDKRIGIAKGVFKVPDNIDAYNDEVAKLFLGVTS